jgi:hypothetical protein
MEACQYIEWSREQKKLVICGEPGKPRYIIGVKGVPCLCDLHADFAADAKNDYEVKRYKLDQKLERDRLREQKRNMSAANTSIPGTR